MPTQLEPLKADPATGIVYPLLTNGLPLVFQGGMLGGTWGGIGGTLANQTDLQSALNLKAPLASPTFTGVPAAPTAALGTSTTQLATTAFVQSAITDLVGTAGAALNTLGELSDALGDDANFAATMTTALSLKAPLASPALTGTPTSTTAAVDTSTTQIATTAYVINQGYLKSSTAALSYQPTHPQLTALSLAAWSAGTQVLTLTATNTVTLKTLGVDIATLGANIFTDRQDVTGTGAGGTVYTFYGENLASSATTNAVRMSLGPTSTFTNVTAPYMESINESTDAGLAWGTYNTTLSQKMRLYASGGLYLGAVGSQADPGAGKLALSALNLSGATASTLAYLDASKNLVSLGTPTVRGINKVIYIAIRTDGLPGLGGLGTAEDPLDASTESKYTAILTTYQPNYTIYYGEGTFLTKGWGGPAIGRKTAGTGVIHIGAGIDKTIVKASGMEDSTDAGWVFGCNSIARADGFELHNLTIDCDATAQPKWSGSATLRQIGGIKVQGSNMYFYRVKVINFGTNRVGDESFPFSLGWHTIAGDFSNNVVDECIVTQPVTGNDDGCSALTNATFIASQTGTGLVIRNSTVDLTGNDFTYSHGPHAQIVEGCRIIACSEGFYSEPNSAWSNPANTVRNNRYVSCTYGLRAGAGAGSLQQGLYIENNEFIDCTNENIVTGSAADADVHFREVVVTGNRIWKSDGALTTARAINLQCVDRAVVNGNLCNSSHASAVYVKATTSIVGENRTGAGALVGYEFNTVATPQRAELGGETGNVAFSAASAAATGIYIENTAGGATNNSARLAMGPHSGYTQTIAPYIEGYNNSAYGSGNDAGLNFGTYSGGLARRGGITPPGEFVHASGSPAYFYNTADEITNYERGYTRWTSNVFEIGVEKGGTGTDRSINVKTASTNSVDIHTGTVNFRNAAGSLRAWITGSGLLFTDNTYDIGASGANRPKTGYFGTSLVSPILTLAQGTITTVQPVIDASVTWNDAADTMLGWKLNVTDTASAAGSLLIDVGTGGGSYVSQFSVGKTGAILSGGVAVPTISSTDTLSNKTLTAPKFADLGFIADSSGNEMLVFDEAASAINHFQLLNSSAAGSNNNGPDLKVDGDSTDISMRLNSKGAGTVQLISGSATSAARVRNSSGSGFSALEFRNNANAERGHVGWHNASASPFADSLVLAASGNGPIIISGDGTNAHYTYATSTGALTNAVASAISAPAHKLTGAWFTGGDATTTKPHLLIEPSGTTSTGWSTVGTGLGVNAASGFTGQLLDLQLVGVRKFGVSSTGLTLIGGTTSNGAGNLLQVYGASTWGTSSQGRMTYSGNDAYIDAAISGASLIFRTNGSTEAMRLSSTGLMTFAGATNSFPAIGRDAVNGFTLQSAAGTVVWNDASTTTTLANRYLFGIAAPTLTTTDGSVDYTVASTFYIGGAPSTGGNPTIGTAYALLIAAGNLGLGAGSNISLATATGTKIGIATNQLLGFWNATPIVQPASANQAALAAQGQASLTDSTTGTPGTVLGAIAGVTYATDAPVIRDAIASIAARLAEVKTDVTNVRTLLTAMRTAAVDSGLIKGAA